jgi:hypothetical protein
MRTRRGLVAAALTLLAAIGLFAAPAFAAPRRASAEVILVRHPRVYLTLRDSLALLSGDRVTFRRKKDALATGRVANTLNGELAVVRIDSGSIAKIRKLSRIEVWFERSGPPSRPLLRVGYPATSRANLLFACDRLTLALPLPPGAYRAGAASERSASWTRDPAVTLSAPWPDTLVARFFEDAADEEIALERGELDVAVFWPGELSRHMRDQSRWQGHLFGTRTRGVVAAFASTGDSSAFLPDTSALGRMNRELFRGDLQPWNGAATPPVPVRYEVDLACPGWREMQRFLDRFAPATARRIRLTYVDQPIASLGSAEASHMTPVFLLRCPVVCAAELRPYLTALDPISLVNALDCTVRERKP